MNELKNLSFLPKDKVSNIKNQLLLNEDEEIVFMDTIMGKSRTQIALKIGCCEKTVTNIRKNINIKISKLRACE